MIRKIFVYFNKGKTVFLWIYTKRCVEAVHLSGLLLVWIAGNQDEGVHLVLIRFFAGPGGQPDVYKELCLFHPVDHNVRHGTGDVGAEYSLRACAVGIVIEHDFGNLQQTVLVQIAERCAQLAGVWVFAVHHLFALVQKIIYAALPIV